MTQKEKRLQDIVSLTNSELSRADAKFSNIGAINTLLIGRGRKNFLHDHLLTNMSKLTWKADID